MMKKNNSKKRTKSLRNKSVAVVLTAAVIIAIFAAVISGAFYTHNTFNHYKLIAEQLADTAASQMSAEDIVRYYNEVKKIGTFDYDIVNDKNNYS